MFKTSFVDVHNLSIYAEDEKRRVTFGVPYSEQRLLNMDEITGGSPYGAATLAGGDGSRQPSENELAIARFQGQLVAEIAAKLCR